MSFVAEPRFSSASAHTLSSASLYPLSALRSHLPMDFTDPAVDITKADTLRLPLMNDYHIHLRDGPALQKYVMASAFHTKNAIIMPNLQPPVTTAAHALAYRDRILGVLAAGCAARGLPVPPFTPKMTLYLTDATSADDIRAAAETGAVAAVKLYPAGATTNSASGVTDIRNVDDALAEVARCGLVLCVHGEATNPAVDLFDREKVFLTETLTGILERHPTLKVVLEHVTSRAGVEFVAGFPSDRIAATITPQHLMLDRGGLFAGGRARPHAYCLPIYKTADDKEAVIAAALGRTQNPHRFFAGTDSAPHMKGAKECASCAAGCYTAPHAPALYAEAFSRAAAATAGGAVTVGRLADFLTRLGDKFYNSEPCEEASKRVLVLKKTAAGPATWEFTTTRAAEAAIKVGAVDGGSSAAEVAEDEAAGERVVPFVEGVDLQLTWTAEIQM